MPVRREDLREVGGWFPGSVRHQAIQEQEPTGYEMWRLPYALIAAYRRWISPYTPDVCRFHPTCSLYAAESLRRYGLCRGGWYAIKRIVRCHPWHPGGLDPVPEHSGD